VAGGKSGKKPIFPLQTPPVLPLSGEGRNGKRARHDGGIHAIALLDDRGGDNVSGGGLIIIRKEIA
jgi:hypothetical protein